MLRFVLGERPWLGCLHELVPTGHAREHTLGALLQEISARAIHRAVVLRHVREISTVESCALAMGHNAFAVLLDHRNDAATKIPPGVRQFRGVALVEAFPGEVAVAVEGDLSQQEKAEGVRTM